MKYFRAKGKYNTFFWLISDFHLFPWFVVKISITFHATLKDFINVLDFFWPFQLISISLLQLFTITLNYLTVLWFFFFYNCTNFSKFSITLYFSIDFYDFPVTTLMITINFLWLFMIVLITIAFMTFHNFINFHNLSVTF